VSSPKEKKLNDRRAAVRRVASNPLIGLASSATLLVTGVILSYLLDKLGVRGLLSAAVLVVATIMLAVSLALLTVRETSGSNDLDELREVSQELRSLGGRISEVCHVLDSSLKLALTSTSHKSLLTDPQYASIEANAEVSQVMIVIRQMAAEFEDEISDRNALLDYQSVVLANLRRGVRYIYFTERTGTNNARARRLAWKTKELSSQISVIMVSPEKWDSLPFSMQTVFLRKGAGELEAYLLLPNGAGKEGRSWVRMSPDYRDQWWGIAEDFLGEAEPLPTSLL
jgi:hypothetical protein